MRPAARPIRARQRAGSVDAPDCSILRQSRRKSAPIAPTAQSTAAGAASTVATGAALAVAAPVAILDPQTRETYGEHLSNVGSGLRDTVGSTVDLAGAPVRAVTGGR